MNKKEKDDGNEMILTAQQTELEIPELRKWTEYRVNSKFEIVSKNEEIH